MNHATTRRRSTALRGGALAMAVAFSAPWMAGCAPDQAALALGANQSQVALRSIQQRWFETDDTALVLRATLATLQDLGFVIDKADAQLGTVSATKVGGGSNTWTGEQLALKLTVTVRTIGEKRTLVRANAQWGLKPVEDAGTYQTFYNSLSKGLFLEAHTVE